ncbi:glucose-1-phosphate adenylyltransferase [Nibricoccus aquaticus]|uniref:Glucose-1-phosphate adenylyltransferase n=1 Tax=Nibricoccus aquaticus TaxID=2576891 RepID=A0A290Q2A2_9BACT|nr:glucose-1-phosphate adenylyltransferase [Nibricoccus aquaticus]ATC62769.1 glucose-1-phosphate adenylyltransferase [Nibricoccus aquaticus]
MATPKVISVIMGGGRGTRLYPLTMERCKPAVPLAGKYRLVDIPISNCINSGLNRIFLLTQFHTASLHRHVQATYHFDPFGGGFVDILSAEQTEKSVDWYQGTADAVRRNLQHFRTFPHDLVLILSGDQLYRMDFRKIIEQHMSTGADVTIAAIPFPVSKVEGLGLTRVNDDLSIAQFVEKPKDPAVINSLTLSAALEAKLEQPVAGEKHCLASMGIYVFNRTALAEALDNNMTDFGKEIIPGLLGKKKLFAHIFEGYWEDIGTVKAFFDANLALAQPLPPFNFFDAKDPIYTKDNYLPASKINNCAIDYVVIGDGSIIEDSTLKHCVLGIRSFVREGTQLQDVVMMGSDFYETPEQLEANVEQGRPHLGLGKGCIIRGAIIDKNSRIGDGVTLTVDGKPDGTYPHGVIIRDGVLLVPKGGVVPNGTVI